MHLVSRRLIRGFGCGEKRSRCLQDFFVEWVFGIAKVSNGTDFHFAPLFNLFFSLIFISRSSWLLSVINQADGALITRRFGYGALKNADGRRFFEDSAE